MAWTFTRLSSLGYPQYLRNVDDVNCPRFLFWNYINKYQLRDYFYYYVYVHVGFDDEKTNWAAEKCYGEFKNILGGSLTVGADMPIGNSPFYIGISISGSMRGYEKSMRWKEGTSLLRSQTERLTAFNAQISPMNIGYIAKLSKNTALDFHVGCFFSYDMAATLSSETVFNDDSMDKDSYDISYLKDHGNYTIYDIGFNGGAGLWFNHWIIDFSYQRGIASMFNNGNDFYSKKVQLSLGYAF